LLFIIIIRSPGLSRNRLFSSPSPSRKGFSIIIRSPSLYRNRLFSSLIPSRKEFSNNLYNGLIVVNYIHIEIDSNKIPTA
jgi:hypothetical protein